MISVIICSINKVFAAQVQQNIADTIFVPWEAIIIDNTISPRGITEVYNKAVSQTKFNILCFIHEDILFTTQNWGTILIEAFINDSDLGLIGVAGSKYKSKLPSGWFSGISAIDCCNITHLDNANARQIMHYNPDKSKIIQEVVVLDGVFLACPKKVWHDVRFDDVLLKGFHLYDLDFSFRVSEKYKVAVVYNIHLVHLTQGGNFGNQWLDYTLLWHQKMVNRLPKAEGDFSLLTTKNFDAIIAKKWLIRLKHEDIATINQFKWLFTSKIWLRIKAWPNVPLFLLKKYFK